MVSAMAGARVDGCCVVRVIVRIWRQMEVNLDTRLEVDETNW